MVDITVEKWKRCTHVYAQLLNESPGCSGFKGPLICFKTYVYAGLSWSICLDVMYLPYLTCVHSFLFPHSYLELLSIASSSEMHKNHNLPFLLFYLLAIGNLTLYRSTYPTPSHHKCEYLFFFFFIVRRPRIIPSALFLRARVNRSDPRRRPRYAGSP